MKDNFLVGEEAIKAVTSGVNKMANAVKQTLGAEGKLALMQSHSKYPSSSKDGVSVLRAIKLACPFESLGANTLLEASELMLQQVGDNTTSAIVLAQEMINSGMAVIESGYSHQQLKEEMQKRHLEVVEKLKKSAVPMKTFEDTLNIATISANGDKAMGTLIAKAFERVGNDGQINVEESDVTDVVFQEGMKINSGYFLPHFVTNTVQKTSVLKDVKMLIINGTILKTSDIADVVNQTKAEDKALLIVCDDVDDEVMRQLILAKLDEESPLKVCVVKSPSYGENKVNILEDLAVYSGGKVWDKKHSDSYTLGVAQKVIVSEDHTYIITDGIAEGVKERADELRAQKTNDELKNRLASIENNVAVIKISSSSTADLTEKKARLDDAIRAVKSTTKLGYITGGGISLLRLGKEHSSNKGEEVYNKSLCATFTQILKNGGVEANDVAPKLLQMFPEFGYNIRSKKIENFYETGVIDSVEIIIASLNNALTLTNTILSTNVLII